ncbi:MAG: hypothetical protein V1824_04635, partial [archaeon]
EKKEIPKTNEISDSFFMDDTASLTKDSIDISSNLNIGDLNSLDSNTQTTDFEKEDFDFAKSFDTDFKNISSASNDNSINKTDELNFDINLNKTPKEEFTNNLNLAQSQNSDNASNVWQSGLITTINIKLSELEAKQKTSEEYLKKRIEEELGKVTQLQSSNKQLLLAKIEQSILNYQNTIKQESIKEITRIKIEDAKLSKKIQDLDTGRNEINELILKLKETDTSIRKLEDTTREDLTKIVASTTLKLNEKIKQINDTLALQSRITKGLIQSTQSNISLELENLNKFRENIQKQIDPKAIYNKLSELDEFKETMANRYADRFESVKIEFLNKAKDAYKKEIETELSSLKTIKDTIVTKTDPEIINKKLIELENFEKNLLKNIDEQISNSLNIYKATITQEWKEKIKDSERYEKIMEEQIKQAQIAQERISELDKFKDQFIAVIDRNIEKMNINMQLLNKKIEEGK